jgi:hypothetical protein
MDKGILMNFTRRLTIEIVTGAGLAFVLILTAPAGRSAEKSVLVPQIQSDWWQVADVPDLGKYNSTEQEPVDFAVWQAADGTWQMWSCIRKANNGGKTRLLYRWQGTTITDRDWQPMGIAMEADPNFGEMAGGLQAPYVLKVRSKYIMFYGDWNHIDKAISMDGKTFARQLGPNGRSGMFSEGAESNTRDPMVIRIHGTFYAYYTANPENHGADFVRTSRNLDSWSPSKTIAYGGSAGTGHFSAECPFVYYHKASGYYYLFRTQRYGEHAQTSIYRSKDPLKFGVNDDRYLVGTLPIAAPEIVEDDGQLYIAALLPGLKGIRIAKLDFAPALSSNPLP